MIVEMVEKSIFTIRGIVGMIATMEFREEVADESQARAIDCLWS